MEMYELCLLHARSDRALRGSVAARLEESQLTMMEWLLLGVIAKQGGDGMTMSEIAETLHVTLPQVTALVNKLLPMKVIKQKSAQNDRRSRIVSLTPKGEAVFNDASVLLQSARTTMFADASEAELNGYIATMKKVIDQE